MTPASLALNLENTADELAAELWGNKLGVLIPRLEPDTRKSLRRTVETLNMILEGDIRSPQDMAAEVEGRVSE